MYLTEKPQEKLGRGHEEKDDEQKDIHCAIVNMSLEVISMCVLHVIVKHKLPNRIVKIYAMVDT